MELISPNYYKNFKCINKECRHTCCIGWEIDVDEKALSKYESANGEYKAKLERSIALKPTPHFILDEKERCPHLREDGLCDLIINLGEDYLCEICKNHPRFFNEYDTFCEAGLGICCESALKPIICTDEKFSVPEPQNPTEEERCFLDLRSRIIDVVQNRDIPYDDRILLLKREFNINLPEPDIQKLADLYLSLEILDKKWEEILHKFRQSKEKIHNADDLLSENLLVYFVYRHLCEALWEGDLAEKLRLCLHMTEAVRSIYEYVGEDFCEIARMYSAEIEYSDENPQKITKKYCKS